MNLADCSQYLRRSMVSQTKNHDMQEQFSENQLNREQSRLKERILQR